MFLSINELSIKSIIFFVNTMGKSNTTYLIEKWRPLYFPDQFSYRFSPFFKYMMRHWDNFWGLTVFWFIFHNFIQYWFQRFAHCQYIQIPHGLCKPNVTVHRTGTSNPTFCSPSASTTCSPSAELSSSTTG